MVRISGAGQQNYTRNSKAGCSLGCGVPINYAEFSGIKVWPIMAHFHSDVEPLSKYYLVMLHLSPATGINS